MSNILFLFNNIFDLATLVESSQDDDFPTENLQNPFRTKVWKTASGVGTANLVINHGIAKAVSAVAIVNYDWEDAPSTLDLEFNMTDSWGDPSETESLTWLANPDVYGNPNIIIKTFASKSYQYNRLNIVHGSQFQIGRIFLGTYFEPTRDYVHERTEKIVDPSFVDLTVGGQEHVDELTKYREREITFRFSEHQQYQYFQQLINSVGFDKNIVVAFDYDDYPGEQTLYGKIKEYDPRMEYNLYEFSMLFRESR